MKMLQLIGYYKIKCMFKVLCTLCHWIRNILRGSEKQAQRMNTIDMTFGRNRLLFYYVKYPMHFILPPTYRQQKRQQSFDCYLSFLFCYNKLFVTIHAHYIDFFCCSKAITTTRTNIFSCATRFSCLWCYRCTISTCATSKTTK